MTREVDAQEVVDRLVRGGPVTLLDVRDAEDAADWPLPGAEVVPAYESLAPIEAWQAPRDRPVVAVCHAGNRSRLVADALARRGYDAASLRGGMLAWSLAWDAVDVPIPSASVSAVQLRRAGKGCLSYILAARGEAVVVDPSLDPEAYTSTCAERGWRVVAVVDTHVHADHLSRGPALARRTGARYLLPGNPRSRLAYEPLREGDAVAFGGERLEVLAVPGHTDEGVALHLAGRAVLTGDTLFPTAPGRPDLGSSPDEARRKAKLLHDSLARLLALAPATLVLGAHAAGPLLPGSAPVVGTIGAARAALPEAAKSAEAFAEAVVERLPPPPENFAEIVDLNVRGVLPDDPAKLEAGGNRCAAR